MQDFSKSKRVPLAALEAVIREELQSGGSTVININGVSMLPLLKDGKSEVRIVPARFPLKKYQVPLYKRRDGCFVLHRVIGVKQDGYICRGDHQTVKEYPVTDDMVIGVMSQYRSGGRWKNVSSPLSRLLAYFLVHTALPRAYCRAIISKFRKVTK